MTDVKNDFSTMKPKFINGKWYIEIYTKEFGDILLLDDSGLPIAKEFDSEEIANQHIKTIINSSQFYYCIEKSKNMNQLRQNVL